MHVVDGIQLENASVIIYDVHLFFVQQYVTFSTD